MKIKDLGNAPQWLKDAEVEKADVTITDGVVTWHGGIWYDGIWMGGEWLDGTWKNGVWNDGFWDNGRWEDGIWNEGEWYKGTWRDGEWNKGSVYCDNKLWCEFDPEVNYGVESMLGIVNHPIFLKKWRQNEYKRGIKEVSEHAN